jgi:peptide/nickel transport system permease protein
VIRLARDFVRILRDDKTALVGAVIVAIYCLIAILGPIVLSYGNPDNAAAAYLPPSWHDPLGTGPFGESVLSELIIGTRPIMIVGVLTAIFSMTIGTIVGLASGYLGGRADSVLMRITDVVITIPGLPLVIVIASIVKSANPVVLAVIISLQAWTGLARSVRSQALSLRSSSFIEAARAQALPVRHMIVTELLPNVGPYVAINFLLVITGAIYAEIGLFVLGAAPESGTNWGQMINIAMSQGALYTSRSILYLMSPIIAIVLLQVGFVQLSRASDVLFNPRVRVA